MNNNDNDFVKEAFAIFLFVAFICTAFGIFFNITDKSPGMQSMREQVQVSKAVEENNYIAYVLYEKTMKVSAWTEKLVRPHYFSVVNAAQSEQGTIYTTDKGEIIMENMDGITWVQEDGTSKHFPDGIMKKWSDQD